MGFAYFVVLVLVFFILLKKLIEQFRDKYIKSLFPCNVLSYAITDNYSPAGAR